MWLDLRYTHIQGRDKTLANRAKKLADVLGRYPNDGQQRRTKIDDLTENTSEGQLIQIYTRAGERVYPSAGQSPIPFPWPWGSIRAGRSYTDVRFNEQWYRIFACPIVFDGQPAFILVAGQLEEALQFLWRFARSLVTTVPLLLFASTLGGYFLSRRALQPVDRLTASVRSISIGNLSRRLPVTNTHDELQRLAETCNDMLARLEAAVHQITRFTGDASHELRSPLTVMRGLAELTLRNPRIDLDTVVNLHGIVAESQQAEKLLEEMLTLARADAGHAEMTFESVEIIRLVSDVCEKARAMAEAKRHVLRMSAPPADIHIMGDPASLRRVVWILLDNAVKYSPDGGEIEVRVHDLSEGCTISVRDNGIGIPADALPHIFERFYRADASRGQEEGAGLGLSIGQWIADAHGAKFTVKSKEHLGTTFHLAFPHARTFLREYSMTAASSSLSD